MSTVSTTKGDMDDSQLEKREGVIDNDIEFTTWVEYWLPGELAPALAAWAAAHPDGEVANGGEMTGYVHRSVSMQLKTSVFAESAVGGLG